ncbi:MAG: hypothetical protein A2289_24140 [Deltaproteobacteria bacterium RIFOXYA12_FULL_58_15]|nr:MAG: hypothetical protein A2289_24140 [Deltaproteobacteria bacterium RIFOXYA12_FULL_58_15]OGR08029.1 MAG: hypothetical protein A2341_04075 [Deltaproteobacteria bacterium RIFOXYB12_FULL_58_9]
MSGETTFLGIEVGPFKLALPAERVVGVLTEVPVAGTALFRGENLPFVDLSQSFCNTDRQVAPYAVVFEANAPSESVHRAIVGVDAVDHLRPGDSPAWLTMPRFGLHRPDLFEAALRNNDGLLLILRPSELAKLVIE